MRSRRTLKDSLQERRRNLFNWNSTGILGPRPALVLNFIEGFALDPRITFARADATTCATRYNASGLLETVAANVPRFDYDPVTLAAKGLLIEESRANLLLQSNAFSTTWGGITAPYMTKTQDVTSPTGAVDGWSFIENNQTSQKYVNQDYAGSLATVHTVSIFVKAVSGSAQRYLGIRLSEAAASSTNKIAAVFNPNTGAWLTAPTALGAATSATGSIQAVGNGWYRVSVSGSPNTTGTGFRLHVAITNGANELPSYLGVTGSGLNVFGAQLEAATFPTSYIPTAASAVTRAADSALVTGTNFSDWYNQTEGTFVCGAVNQFVTGAVGKTWLHVSTATLNDRYTGQVSTAGKPQQFVVSGGTTQVDGIGATLATLVANTPFKTAFGYKVNDFAIAVDGQTAVTDTLGALPVAVDRMRIGGISTTNTPFNGHIRSVSYYNTRLTDAELQRLSV